MPIMTRRNAIVGWLAVKTWRMVARRLAKRVGEKLASFRISQKTAIVLSVLVVLVGAIGAVLLRLRGGDSRPDQ